jgi:glycosyltransferase involved in cell wall biosynthesis
MPKVSIITPVWCDISQKVDWLGEMIESVQSQTLADWEMILINDKSPLSLDPVKMKFTSDERLRWFENAENSGPAKTRNSAVGLSRAECILPLDSDDMLANDEALENLYDAWIMDKTKTIYGNIQLYQLGKNGNFERSKTYQLAHYSFEGAMNLQFGIMPVTTMHSKDAHYKAGGWKPALVHGREDLEHWISCGKAGFCGHKINHTTLLYRKHEQSRDYKLKFELKKLEAVQQQIKAMHPEIYKGVFPMACCGGKGKVTQSAQINDPVVMSRQNQTKGKITLDLPGVDEKLWVWKKYIGRKKGNFAKISRVTQIQYMIQGPNHIFPVHQKDKELTIWKTVRDKFIDVSDPREKQQPEIIAPSPIPTVTEIPQPAQPAQPEMSIITRPDRIAVEDGLSVQTVERPIPEAEIITAWKITDLELSDRVTEILKNDGYIFSDLLTITPQKLSSSRGIGIKTANKIIAKAQELIK